MKTLLLLLIASATLSMAGCYTSSYQTSGNYNRYYQQSYPTRSYYQNNRVYEVDVYKRNGCRMEYEGYYYKEPVVLESPCGRRYIGPHVWN